MPELIADIAVFAPLRQLFSYRVDESLHDSIRAGQGVVVPFGRRRLSGIVVALRRGSAERLKDVAELLAEEPLLEQALLELCCWAADYYRYPVGMALRSALPAGLTSAAPRVAALSDSLYRPLEVAEQPRGSKQREVLDFIRSAGEASLSLLRDEFSAPHAILERLVEQGFLSKTRIEKLRDPFLADPVKTDQPLPLTEEQQAAFERLQQAVLAADFAPFLLQGVTGSGKTEVYLQTIAEVLKQGRQGLVLVPEIALTPQLVGRFRARFEAAGYRIAVLHSGLSDGERFDSWRQIARGDIHIVIGARSAIFAPLQNPGLIIVDEEHESSYKQGEGFRYNARDLALLRGQKERCPVLLGSATPSLGSAYRCAAGQMEKLELTRRAHAGALPKVQLINLSGQPPEQLISTELQETMAATLAAGRQILLLLNRRGFSPFLLCADCGQTFRCPNCEITLTYHQKAQHLRCHYCDYRMTPPVACPGCEGHQLNPEGFGTERLEQEIAELFPAARIARMDRDTTSHKGAHQKIVREMFDAKIDILVGTQMIAKGHDFPGVALVGVLASDAVLNLPDFRAAERAFSLLTQVAGRAGRTGGGQVLIQTYSPDHYALQCAAEQDYSSFYAQEIQFRQELGYPPAGYLANLVFAGIGEAKVLKAAESLTAYLIAAGSSVEILGPSPCPLFRLRGKSRIQLLLKAEKRPQLKRLLDYADQWKLPAGVSLSVDVDPLDMF